VSATRVQKKTSNVGVVCNRSGVSLSIGVVCPSPNSVDPRLESRCLLPQARSRERWLRGEWAVAELLAGVGPYEKMGR
jgi:hypothetical protein